MHRVVHKCRERFSGQRGFTLFEIVMVLLILGVISYFVATRLFSADAPTQNAEMELVKNHLRFAQSRAMNSDKEWGVKFVAPNRYWMFKAEDGENVVKELPDVKSLMDDMKKRGVLNNPPLDGSMTLSSVSVQNVVVKFDQFGSPGTAPIIITTTAGTITITKNTGFIP
jgi:prepilin-type N-terminal cleavage/methylation domain-containing protein